MNKKYTDEYLLDLVKAFVKKNGRIPTTTDVRNKLDFPVYHTILDNRFGSHNNAIRRAGFIPNISTSIGETKYTNEELLALLREAYNKVNRIPTNTDFLLTGEPDLSRMLRNRFGNMRSACHAAGIIITPKRRLRFFVSKLANLFLRGTEKLNIAQH